MSFCSEVKKEISLTLPEKECCKKAELSGLIRTAGSLKPAGKGGVGVLISTGNPSVARHIKALFDNIYDIDCTVSVANKGGRVSRKRYELNIAPSQEIKDILIELGILISVDGLISISKGISDNLKTKCCRKNYLKGLFLGAGSIADPNRSYHFDMSFPNQTVATDARRLMNTFTGIKAGVSSRRDKYVVYLKSAEQIKDVLGIIDANRHYLEYENVRFMRDMRNSANRISNCDSANISRLIQAVDTQMVAIKKIEKHAGLDSLPSKLRDTAIIRKENPEASMSEMALLFDPPVSKSTVASRLKKIEVISIELEKLLN